MAGKTAKADKPKAVKAAKSSAAKAKKPSQGPRKSPKEVKDAVFHALCEQSILGVDEMSKLDLAMPNGYQNPRSEGFTKIIKELREEGLIENGSKKDHLKLTEKGKGLIPKDLVAEPKDISEVHERYINLIVKKLGNKSEDKVRQVWKILSDRKEHGIESLAKDLGYNNPRSFANTKIIATMKEAEIAMAGTQKGTVVFTNKPFPGGTFQAI